MTSAPDASLMQRSIRSPDEAREIVCRVAVQFHRQGWVVGTSGGLSVRHEDRIYLTPSGVQKEHLAPEMIFVLDLDGRVVDGPRSDSGLRVSQSTGQFLAVYRQTGAGAIFHTHSLQAVLASQ